MSHIRRAFHCYSLLPVSKGKAGLEGRQGAWSAQPMSPQKPATSSIFPLTTSQPHILHSSLTPFYSFSSVAIAHCQTFYSSGLVPSDYLCNMLLCQNPPLSCLSCVQLMIQSSSWLNWVWLERVTFSCHQSRGYLTAHSTMLPYFNTLRNIYRLSIKR